jgi:pimeloyl-ACP methyl ester carboxylesterase
VEARSATAELAAGPIRYRESGAGKVVLFVHGLLVDGALWRKVIPHLDGAYRCIVPDWPLGSHVAPLNASADRSPRGMAHLIADFIKELDLEDVTIVANDTGGAISQILVTERPDQIGRLVLTPCDAYENFLPPPFKPLQWAARVPIVLRMFAQPMRLGAVRRSPLGFGLLTKRPIPDEITRAWLEPTLNDARIRDDVIALLRQIDPHDTLLAAERLRDLDMPVLIVWARKDLVFKLRYGERLARDIPGARLEVLDDTRSFVPEDVPERLAELISGFVPR